MSLKESRFQAPNQDGLHAQRMAHLTYDFAVHGGAVGTINLGVNPQNTASALGLLIPQGANIRSAWFDVITPLTSGGAATIAFSSGETAADLFAATAITTAGTAGIHDGIPNGTAANTKKTTLPRQPTLTIAAAALTAGKLVLHVLYTVTG
jgi:hypothetical protein